MYPTVRLHVALAKLLWILILCNKSTYGGGYLRRRSLINMEAIDTNRTAVCITGQPRSLPLEFRGGHILYNRYSMDFRDLDGTIADNIANFIAKETEGGGVDVYMIVPNNDVLRMTPHQRATACDIMYKYPLFGKNRTGEKNHLFCHVMQEEEAYNLFTDSIPHVNEFADGKSEYQTDVPFPLAHRIAKEKYFQQLWALQYCNNIIKGRVASGVVHYKYKMRIRPDLAFGPGSSITKSLLGPSRFERFHLFKDRTGISPGSPCNSSIIITDYAFHPGGNQDTFGFGKAEDMDLRFNLYDAIVYKGLISQMQKAVKGLPYMAESILEYYLFKHGICLKSDSNLKAAIIRTDHYSAYGANLHHSAVPASGLNAQTIKVDVFTSWVDVGPPADWPLKTGQLVKLSPHDKAIYIYLNETLRLIPSWESFTKHEFQLQDVKIIPNYWSELAELMPIGKEFV